MKWASEIEPKPIDWLWKPYIARGMLSSFMGDPGCGKSTLLTYVIARLTRGEALPGCEALPPMNCLILCWEDPAAVGYVPRIINHGGDRSRVIILEKFIELNKAVNLKMLDAVIKAHKIGMVLIDSHTSYTGADVGTNNMGEASAWMYPLHDIAARNNCAISIVRHTKKGKEALVNPVQAGLGSQGYTGTVRVESLVRRMKNGHTLQRSKANYGKDPDKGHFKIESVPGNDVGKLEWTEGAEAEIPKAKAHGKAVAFLREFLKHGPKPSGEVYAAGAKLKLSQSTLKRARERIGHAREVRPKEWVWELAESGPKVALAA